MSLPIPSPVVFITGASSGIGYAAALEFCRTGARVGATARRAEKLGDLQAAVDALPPGHGDLLTLTADVRDSASMNAAVAETLARFGRLDVVIANAGLGHRGALADAAWEDVETLLRTNIDGVIHTLRAAIPALRVGGGGSILIVSSVVFNMVTPYAALYSASKAFVSSLSRSLRLELASANITVTDVLIGRTETEFNQRRLGAAGYAARAPRLPVMTPEFVARGLVRASQRRPRTVVLRWLDRLIVWANGLLPDAVGGRALRQYRTDR